VSANTAVTSADSPVSSATSRSIPTPPCDTTPCPYADTLTRETAVASGWQLILAFLAGIAVIVVLITVVKLHPFLALIFGALTVGIVAGEDLQKVLKSFADGFGSTAAGVGILIALGAMFAKLLADSGGADEIVDTIVGHASPRALPWAMALVGAIIGLPMFFEIGLVLLMPVIYLVSRRSQLSLITVGIPALAGLSAMHGFVPPAPGPADRHSPTQRRPGHHARPGCRGGDPDDHCGRPAVREAGRALGRGRSAPHLRPGHLCRRGR
jgi:GntP family permease